MKPVGYFLGAVAVALVFGVGWAVWVLPPFNSEHLGGDFCHHAIMVYGQSLPDRAERTFVTQHFHDYPQTAHWLAARLLPLVDDDPYKALRVLSIAQLVLTFAVQFALMRCVVSRWWALVGTAMWAVLSAQTSTAHSHVTTFFYAQALGTAFLWCTLLFANHLPPCGWRRWANLAIITGLACLSYLCHIVPGVSALGGVGVWLLVNVIRERRWSGCVGMVVFGVVGLAVVFGTRQLAHMSSARVQDGDVPLKNVGLQWLWLPTFFVASVWYGSRWWRATPRTAVDVLWEVALCVLFVTGALNLYCIYEWQQGKAAAYSYKKFYYVLGPTTALVWLLAGWRLAHARGWQLHGWFARHHRPLLTAAAIGMIYVNVRGHIRSELLPEHVSPERHPVRVARELLAEQPPWERGPRLYYDPQLVQTNTFINIVGLRRTFQDVQYLRQDLEGHSFDQPIPPALQLHAPYSVLLLPK